MSKMKSIAPGQYTQRVKAVQNAQKAWDSWWSHSAVGALLTVFFAFLDGVVLYDIMNHATVTSGWMGVIICFGTALGLNFLPVLLAGILRKKQHNLETGLLFKLWLGIALFVVFFAATVILRFAFHDLYGNTTGVGTLVNQAAAEVAVSDNRVGPQSLAVVLFLSVEPLFSSGLNFLYAYWSDYPLKRRIRALECRKAELEDEIDRTDVEIEALRIDRDELRRIDDAQYQRALAGLKADCERLEAESRMMLAERLKDPDSISALCRIAGEENRQAQSAPECL